MPKSNYDIVKKHLGGETADAIRGMITDEISGLREELVALVGRQKENIEVAKTEGSPEAKASANDATVAVKQADQAVKQAEADPTPEKAAVAKEKVEEAKGKVAETESGLAVLTETVECHEIILAPWQKGEKMGDRPKSRFDNIEDELVGVRAASDQSAAASAEALAIAQSSRGPALWIVALVTFGVAFVIMVVAAAFTSLTIFWDAVWVAIGTAVFVTVVTAILDHVMPSASKSINQARAKAKARRERENDDVLGLDQSSQPPKMTEDEAEASEKVAGRR